MHNRKLPLFTSVEAKMALGNIGKACGRYLRLFKHCGKWPSCNAKTSHWTSPNFYPLGVGRYGFLLTEPEDKCSPPQKVWKTWALVLRRSSDEGTMLKINPLTSDSGSSYTITVGLLWACHLRTISLTLTVSVENTYWFKGMWLRKNCSFEGGRSIIHKNRSCSG